MFEIPSRDAISAAIMHVRTAYQAQGMSLYDIGNGACYDFAEDVMDRLFPKAWRSEEGEHDGWNLMESDTLFLPPPGSDCTMDAISWDWELIERHWAIKIPVEDRADLDAIVGHNPTHCWLHFAGRHYDCEHPEGVESFFDLNFFRRWLKRPVSESTV